jgi:glycosyltransferase involved in cell wall biosynthesis
VSSRIAFCITALEAGGAERQLVELVTRLPRDRFEPAVVALSEPPPPPADGLVQVLARHSIPVAFLGGRHPWQAPFVFRRLSRWLNDWQPALLQSFLAHANVLGACAGSRLGIPIVTGIRVAEQRLNGHCWLQRWTSPLVARHVCVSRSVAEFAERVMRLPSDKLAVIPNGVDVARFEQVAAAPLVQLGIPPGHRMILFIGRLEREKRPDWLIERMPAIAVRCPVHDLVVVGRGPMSDNLRRQAARLGIANRVHFAGWRDDVPRLLVAADLVVLTSVAEGMPNAVLEAMAAARPVVATDVHGVGELLGHDTGGQITPSQDEQAFVDAVVQITADSNLSARLGERNFQRAANQFSCQAMAGRYAELYRSLLDSVGDKKRGPGR